MSDFSERADITEWMDELDRPDGEFLQAYAELALVNRYLGGARAVRRFLSQVPEGRILDVAAGGCDIADALSASGPWRFVTLDVNPLGLKRSRHTLPVVADAFRLPFPDGAFDVVTASLFFHHLSEGDCVRMLAGMYRMARHLVIVNDLHRHRIAYGSIRILTHLFSRSAMVRNDAPTSVRRGFRSPDLVRIARLAGVPARVYRSFPYRLVLVARK